MIQCFSSARYFPALHMHKKMPVGTFAGSPVVSTPHFQCRGYKFNP